MLQREQVAFAERRPGAERDLFHITRHAGLLVVDIDDLSHDCLVGKKPWTMFVGGYRLKEVNSSTHRDVQYR